ncbi:hypothetical protein B4U80_09052 [Leptotrombidium deliense]|uniref:W2 domain-containing protein n=1 Tax=Leptotrombidium deliense TaxID=299467 RepID=A0A443SJQ6_9ACAR|nr:hypothetical protein B4U80_09052 [Leptotrombidium deliense]
MSSKVERPTLQGQRIKTRKRDEKEKFDPSAFRDSIIIGFGELQKETKESPQSSDGETNSDSVNENNVIKNGEANGGSTVTRNQLEAIYKFLDSSGSKLDYRRYGEVLFDIIIAGGYLAPGGTIVTDSQQSSKTDLCVFSVAVDDIEAIRGFAQVILKLIRRYMYLEKTLEEEFKKIIKFLKGFSAEDRLKLAKLTAILISGGQVPAHVLTSALQDHFVKDGIAIDFLVTVLQTWLNTPDKDAATVWTSLKKAGLDHKVMEFLPVSKRSPENLKNYFIKGGLEKLLDFQKAGLSGTMKKELQNQVLKSVKDDTPVKEIIALVKEYIAKNNLPENEVSVLLWNTLMAAVEWNKKEELVAEQALKHLKGYTTLMAAFTQSAKAEMALIIRIQEYCYENMNFLKVFQKIIVLFYKTDVLSEDIIIKWYNESHSSKGKSVFLEQIKQFIEWLQNAEEESEGED